MAEPSAPPPPVADDELPVKTVLQNSLIDLPSVPDYQALGRLGHFEILGRIGLGGMAEVYLAREKQDDGSLRHVVVKQVLPELEVHPEIKAMFLEEGRTAVRLYHPHICHVFECGEVDGAAFMALEWVWGISLVQVLERARLRQLPMPWSIAADICQKVASSLQYIHHATDVNGRSLGIVHRDISPHNIMLSWRGAVKLLDFGVARRVSEPPDIEMGSAQGKYAYMSPEQAERGAIDPRSDLFSLGVVLFECLTGRRLYARNSVIETLKAIVEEPSPSVGADADLPEPFEPLVARALRKDPAARFQSGEALGDAIRKVLASEGEMVSETTISLYLGMLFDEDEKSPLPPGARLHARRFHEAPRDAEAQLPVAAAAAPLSMPLPPSPLLPSAPSRVGPRRLLVPALRLITPPVAGALVFFGVLAGAGALWFWLSR